MAKAGKDTSILHGTSIKTKIYIAGLIISVAIMALVYARVAIESGQDKKYNSYISEQRLLALHLAEYSYQASLGNSEAFDALERDYHRLEQVIDILDKGEPDGGLPAVPEEVRPAMDRVKEVWSEFDEKVESIIEYKQSMVELQLAIEKIRDTTPALIALSDEVAQEFARKKYDANSIYIATRQMMLAERILYNVNKILGAEQAVSSIAVAADQFGRDANTFNRVLYGMLNGNRAIKKVNDRSIRAKVLQVEKKYNELLEYIRIIQEHSSFAYIVKESTRDIIGDMQAGHLKEMEEALEGMSNGFTYLSNSIDLYSKGGDFFGVLAMGFLIFTAVQLRSEGRTRLLRAESETEKVEQQNQRNQQAILTLLDELGNLADGDLTVNATVTEDITGAIADSFNYAVDATRRLVRAINETTDQLASASSEASEMALDVASQSNDAANLISDAAQTIYIMSDNIDDISRSSADLAEEAKRSVAIASKGKSTVSETIQGMESIRENIQDTSKRIKRLGESSQQIGEIINLINDIAEQTSILALNASIQAAMAGESGRGFAIVADEVQQLAERAGNSTRQIETIIKGIQTDTNEAIASMEQSTVGVVKGANLAKAAGEDLSEIEHVSLRLADLIFDISSSAQAHSSEQGVIAENMRAIQSTAAKAAEEIGQTVQIISNLTELSNDLKKSVAGFKLPN